MRKKDYEIIAEAVKASNARFVEAQYDRYGNRSHAAYTIAVELADRLEKSNPEFDRTKFLTACGIELQPRGIFGDDLRKAGQL